MNTKEFRNTKGITLIALVVSIIVLLILAGVSIGLLVGENGITGRAVTAKKTYDIAGAKEKLELEVANLASEYYQAKYVNASVGENDVGSYVLGKFSPEETTFEGNYYLKKENSKLILTSNDRTTTATCTVDSNGKVVWEGTEIDDDSLQTTYTWTQYAEEGENAKIWVTNGDVTLEVGQAVSGYSVTATVDGEEKTFSDWYVLGAEEKRLLITMNTCPEEIELSGRNGYANGVDILNSATEKYRNRDMAETVRSINVDDINQITGYNPENAGYGTNELDQYKNEVAYYWDGTEKTYYTGKNGISGNLKNSHSTGFYYYEFDSRDWKIVPKSNSGDIAILTSTGYRYFPETLTDNPSDTQNGISAYDLAYVMLFSNSGDWPGDKGSYWLASTGVVYCNSYRVSFNLRDVSERFCKSRS